MVLTFSNFNLQFYEKNDNETTKSDASKFLVILVFFFEKVLLFYYLFIYLNYFSKKNFFLSVEVNSLITTNFM